jgi:hypothetical protein
MKLAEFIWHADLTPAIENVFTRAKRNLPFPGFATETVPHRGLAERFNDEPGMFNEVAESAGLGKLEYLLGINCEEKIVAPGDPAWDTPKGTFSGDQDESMKRLPIFPDPDWSIEAHDALVNRASALLSQSAMPKPVWAGGNDAAFRGPWLLVFSDEHYVSGRRIQTHRCVLLLLFRVSESAPWLVEAHSLEDGLLVSTAQDAERIRSSKLDYPCDAQEICDLLENFEGELPTQHWAKWEDLCPR